MSDRSVPRRVRDPILPWTVGPGLLYLLTFFALPMVLVAVVSLLRADPAGGVRPALTLSAYARAFDPLYLGVFGHSAWLALLTTLISIAVAYPAAWAIRGASERWRGPLLALVIVPAWMNLLIKNYAWIVLLRRQGLVNSALLGAGLLDEPLVLLFTTPAVLVGLVHTYLPFMVLPLYVALDRMDWSLVEAAHDLGAGPWAVFRRVVVPQTAVGMAVGCTLVFVPALGAFVTPDLLGGPRSLMIGTLIENQILQVRDWPFASALAVLLMVAIAAILVPLRRVAEPSGLTRGA